MPEFPATARMKGDYESLEAVVLVAGGRVKVEASSMELGDWELSEIEVGRQLDGFHVTVDDEELVLGFEDEDAFATALAAERRGRARRTLLPRRVSSPRASAVDQDDSPSEAEVQARDRPVPPPVSDIQKGPPGNSRAGGSREEVIPDRRSTEHRTAGSVGSTLAIAARATLDRWSRLPRRWRLVAGGGVGLAALWVVFPWVVIVGLWAVAAASLLTATIAAVDPYIAVRLPDWALPVRLISTGLSIVFLLLVLALL